MPDFGGGGIVEASGLKNPELVKQHCDAGNPEPQGHGEFEDIENCTSEPITERYGPIVSCPNQVANYISLRRRKPTINDESIDTKQSANPALTATLS